jgi:hypothetical protein
MRKWLLAAVLVLSAPLAVAQEREAREDAWWTGPMLAASAATLPKGHMLIEPYLFDVMSDGHFDAQARHVSASTEHDLGSLTYVLYGLTDRLTVGVIPRFGYNLPPQGPASSFVGVGDFTLQVGYGLTQFHEGSWLPTTSVVVQETLPTGRYQRLSRASDGFGAGAYQTALAFYSQDYFWMPNGRILRARLDLTYTVSSSASVADQSVYGTPFGFRGDAQPGDSLNADLAGEYSLTRHWVVALDIVYQHNASTRITSRLPPGPASSPYPLESGSSYYLGFAPALEYNFSSRIGALLGLRIIEIGRNTGSSVTPALALNMVF